MARVPRPGGGLDVEDGVEGAQPLIDAPEADAAALVEGVAAAPVRRQADAVVSNRDADRAVAAVDARDLHVLRPRVLAHVRQELADGAEDDFADLVVEPGVTLVEGDFAAMSPWARNSSQSSSRRG